MRWKIGALTIASLMAFAANSILCRLALRDPANSAISFAVVRLLSGSISLVYFLVRRPQEAWPKGRRLFAGPLALGAYAFCFALAYVRMGSGTGALILFGSVQLTMMIVAMATGHRPRFLEVLGFSLAAGGFILLVLPGASAPEIAPAVLMTVAGIAWGAYTLFARGAGDPTRANARNFLMTLPLVLVVALLFGLTLTPRGLILAVISGAVTSGLGYALWYSALKGLETSTAAIVQLGVPALTAVGGVLVLGEMISTRLVVASTLIAGGITLKILSTMQGKLK